MKEFLVGAVCVAGLLTPQWSRNGESQVGESGDNVHSGEHCYNLLSPVDPPSKDSTTSTSILLARTKCSNTRAGGGHFLSNPDQGENGLWWTASSLRDPGFQISTQLFLLPIGHTSLSWSLWEIAYTSSNPELRDE